MKWLRAPATVLLGVAALFLVAGSSSCAERSSPQLVQVLEMAPSEAEVGDRLALLGNGFPVGKAARVTFRGALHRPGQRAITDAEVVLAGVVAGPQRVEVPFDEAAQAVFCGVADRAVHTTFDGNVEVAFAASAPGAPPVAGLLRGAVLDIRPSRTAGDAALAAKEGARVLAWIGVRATAGGSGFFVEAAAPDSRAAAAGVLPGDTISTFDGVRVASAADLVPAPGEREAVLGLRHGSDPYETLRTVSIQGFRRAPSTELLFALLLVIAALALVAFFGAPTPPRVAAAILRMASRARLRSDARAGAGHRAAKAGRPGVWRLPDSVEAAACGILVALPFGQYLIASRADVGVLFVSAATALAASTLVARRTTGSARRRGWQGLSDAAHVTWQHAPAALAAISAVLVTGSLRFQEIERAQGGWPWDWLAFRNPAMLVAFFSLLTCARIEPDARVPSGIGAWFEAQRTSAVLVRGPLLESACRVHRIIVAGLASSLFLGGWLLPGLSASEQDARAPLEMAGAVWFLAKTCGLVLALKWTGRAVAGRGLVERSRATVLCFAPASAAALAAAFAWTRWSPEASTQLVVSGSLVAVVSLAAFAFSHRLRHGVSSTRDGRLSVFL